MFRTAFTRSFLTVLVALVVAVLFQPSNALASGSTIRRAQAKHFNLVLETPRMIFSKQEKEARYHAEQRKRFDAEIATMKPVINKVIDRLKKGSSYSFLTLSPKIKRGPMTAIYAQEKKEEIFLKKGNGPCFYIIHLGGFARVEVALKKLPRKPAREKLKAAIAKAVGQTGLYPGK